MDPSAGRNRHLNIRPRSGHKNPNKPTRQTLGFITFSPTYSLNTNPNRKKSITINSSYAAYLY